MSDTKYIAVYQNLWSAEHGNYISNHLNKLIEEIRNDDNDPTDYTFYEIDGSLLTPKKLGYTLED